MSWLSRSFGAWFGGWFGDASATPLTGTLRTLAHRSRTSRAGNDRSAAVAARTRTMRSFRLRAMSALRIRRSEAGKSRRSVPESVTP